MLKRVLMLALLGFGQTAFAAEEGEAAAQQTFGDWAQRCEKSADNKESCFIFQSVTRKETSQLILNVRIGYGQKTGDQPLMILTVPTGVLLPAGAAFMMEGIEPVKLKYLTCTAQACVTMAQPLPAETVDGMKKKVEASVRIADPNQQVVGMPVSLKGFTKALASLTPPN